MLDNTTPGRFENAPFLYTTHPRPPVPLSTGEEEEELERVQYYVSVAGSDINSEAL